MGAFTNIDKNIMAVANRVMSDYNYSPTNTHYSELINLLGVKFKFDPNKIVLSHNIGISIEIINKFFFDDDTLCLIPPNLGKELLDPTIRSFKDWKFFDIKFNKETNIFSYNEDEIKTKIENTDKKKIVLYIGTFFGIQVQMSEEFIEYLGKKDVFIINYMRDSETINKFHFGNICIYHFHRGSEMFTNDVVAICNNTLVDLLPIFANGFTKKGEIICQGYDMLPTPESQVMLIGKIRNYDNIFQILDLQHSIFEKMLKAEGLEVKFIPAIGSLPFLTKEKKEIKIKGASCPFTPEIYKYYDIEFPNNYVKIFSKIIILPFGCSIPVPAMKDMVAFIKSLEEEKKENKPNEKN